MSKPTWDDVLAWAVKQIEASRLELETPGLGVIETELLRARIAVMRELPNIKDIPTAPPFMPPSVTY